MTYLAVRTIGAILKGAAYLLSGLLFGALPLLVVILWKVLKGGTVAAYKVTLWAIGAIIAGADIVLRSA